ncbi:hypothetical protein J6590_046088 [Homalodisca vitripennis]|nr:hypothetical protein J6590_046088 [Homalodisca vitripennis]
MENVNMPTSTGTFADVREETVSTDVCEETVREETFNRGFPLNSTTQLVRPGKNFRWITFLFYPFQYQVLKLVKNNTKIVGVC